MTLKLVMGLGPGDTSRLAQVVLVPVEQAQPVPVGRAYWNRLCLSHWHKQAGCTKPVPLGLGEVKRDLSLCHGRSLIPTMEVIPCAMAQALYHDGTCTCSTCAKLCKKVGIQGRGKILWNEFCPFHEITGFTLTLLDKVWRSENSEENSEESRLFPFYRSKFSPATGSPPHSNSHRNAFEKQVFSTKISNPLTM